MRLIWWQRSTAWRPWPNSDARRSPPNGRTPSSTGPTACWTLFGLGLDPAIVAEKLGHADPAFTVKRYVGVRGNPDERATKLTEHW
jgi:hypothetical protein